MRDDLDVRGEAGRSIAERYARRVRISAPAEGNDKLTEVFDRVNADDDLYGQWIVANVTAIERLGMTDHGPVHVKIVMNIALKMVRLLMRKGVESGVSRHYGLDPEDAEVVVVLAALLHDLGMSIHRKDHEGYSLFLADTALRSILPEIYDARTASILRSEILHAIISHRSGGVPLTLEAGVVRIADALDMAKGRSRIPFERGSQSIHSISAAAIESVEILEGDDKPVRILVTMSNSAGVFQLDRLFREKLKGSGLEDHVELEALVAGESETEKRLIQSFRV